MCVQSEERPLSSRLSLPPSPSRRCCFFPWPLLIQRRSRAENRREGRAHNSLEAIPSADPVKHHLTHHHHTTLFNVSTFIAARIRCCCCRCVGGVPGLEADRGKSACSVQHARAGRGGLGRHMEEAGIHCGGAGVASSRKARGRDDHLGGTVMPCPPPTAHAPAAPVAARSSETSRRSRHRPAVKQHGTYSWTQTLT